MGPAFLQKPPFPLTYHRRSCGADLACEGAVATCAETAHRVVDSRRLKAAPGPEATSISASCLTDAQPPGPTCPCASCDRVSMAAPRDLCKGPGGRRQREGTKLAPLAPRQDGILHTQRFLFCTNFAPISFKTERYVSYALFHTRCWYNNVGFIA